MSSSIKKVLIANRGEIAVRVIRACHEVDITAVAVYSDTDRLALHVRLADEAYHIGPSPSKDSYLVQDKILQVAVKSGADAIHPGYGFLAENAEFAERVGKAGLLFIGPSPEAMRVMGDKTAARQSMSKAGVPIVPGTENPISDSAAALKVAREVGFPVMLKAAAGGGGKGMRLVRDSNEIEAALRAASSEAASAFGDGRVYIEKYIEAPRHIEFQILADHHGNIVHFGERECSIQRRHQKVIEEAPSCVLDDELREKMGQAAVKAAAACGYRNAGTIEFMFDQSRNFYFLEMNTRLQVEHPVTEMITGVDLVKEQLRVAAGEPLGYSQKDIQFRGHAVECRIYAEDPANNFLPSTGTIEFMSQPSGPGIRDDNGYYTGCEVSIFYDPLISKLVAWANDRDEAIARMIRALREYLVHGIDTSIPFCQMVMNHPDFVAGNFDTHFVEKEFLSGSNAENVSDDDQNDLEIAALAATLVHMQRLARTTAPDGNRRDTITGWKRAGRNHR